MEQLPEKDIEPIEASAPEDAIKPSAGYVLRTAREKQGLSIEEVVAKIKLAPRQIIALEADDFKALPELAFIRGFVRSYAKLLQLEVQPLLDALPGAVKVNAEPAQVEITFPAEKKLRQQNVNLLVAAFLVALLIAVFVVWQARTVRPAKITSDVTVAATPSEQAAVRGAFEMIAITASEVPAATELATIPASIVSASMPVTQPVPVAAPVVTGPVAAPLAATISASTAKTALRLVFDKESWAEIKDQSGKTLSRQVNQPGSELRLEGTAPFTLVIGHAASVHLFYREKPVDLSSYVNAGSDVARMTLK